MMIRKITSLALVFMFSLVMVMPSQGFAQALPENGVFINGNGQIEINGNMMDVNSLSNKSIVEWLSFCIQQGYTVNFNQPSSAAAVLNRVTGANPSEILGNLMSNGQVFLINPNGILFGASSSVNAAGLVASTLNISDDDFLNGNYQFLGQGGSVVNQGSLSSPGGYVALLGSSVDNSGVIVSQLGTVVMASGEKITLGLDASGLISVAVDEAVTQNLGGADAAIKNTGTINADGGTVILTSKALDGVFNKAINNEGIIEAVSLQNNAGSIELIADGAVTSLGTLRANLLTEQGASFEIGGVYDVESASVQNDDGAVLVLTGNYSGSISDAENIIIDDNAVINLIGDFEFHADSDDNGSGFFHMLSGSKIKGDNHDLTITSGGYTYLRDISNVKALDVESGGTLDLLGQINTSSYADFLSGIYIHMHPNATISAGGSTNLSATGG